MAEEDLTLHGVTITHPDRIVFAEGKITKGDVARYSAAVAPLLLREIQSRLLGGPGYVRRRGSNVMFSPRSSLYRLA